MKSTHLRRIAQLSSGMILLASLLCQSVRVRAQDTGTVRAVEVYGFAMTDMGYNFDQINPAWFDALRVTKLPAYDNQYPPNGNAFFGIRQSRFGVKGWTETPVGKLKGVFEFDLFGVGADEGQTTMRMRHVYGELGRILVGQTNSPFMDGDIFPNTLEYWGPTGMVFFRNVQIRYAAMTGVNEVYIALERPGASADQGSLGSREELDSVAPRSPLPDLSAHYKRSGDWGHVQIAGMLRDIRWEDIHRSGGYNVSGGVIGWGLDLTGVVNLTRMDVLRAGIVYGAGVENYMNDAPYDVGLVEQPNDPSKPFKGKALPVTGGTAFIDHNWNPKMSTSFGYSFTSIQNTTAGSYNAYKFGQYAIVNFLMTPFKNFMGGVELQWGQRENYGDGYTSHAIKMQFSFKYNFSAGIYERKGGQE